MGDSTHYQLLLIDDDEDEYVLTRGIIHEMNVTVSLDWADSYHDAVKIVLQELHDVYLVDYYLGAQTGIELLRDVRERGCRAPIIILTGRDDNGIDMEALEAGATDYLDKNTLNAVLLERSIRYAIRQQNNHNRLEDLVKQVTRLEQIKTDMIRIAAHDLRTPLTVLRGYIEIFEKEIPERFSPQEFGYVTEMRDAINRMQRMVGDILSLERIAEISGGYTTPVNLTELIQEIYEAYSQKGSHRFSLDVGTRPITVYGSIAELREAVENLFTNAVKYTPTDGEIRVSLSADPDVALFTVRDTGYGIPREQQEKLFQPFFRAKTRETRKIDGTGLGLHLVKNIVERHNGHIHFESEYGQGSTFGFMLPQVESEP